MAGVTVLVLFASCGNSNKTDGCITVYRKKED